MHETQPATIGEPSGPEIKGCKGEKCSGASHTLGSYWAPGEEVSYIFCGQFSLPISCTEGHPRSGF